MHRRLELPKRRSQPAHSAVGLLPELKHAINRLQVGEFTLIVCDESVIRIERSGNVCVYCDIPIALSANESGGSPWNDESHVLQGT